MDFLAKGGRTEEWKRQSSAAEQKILKDESFATFKDFMKRAHFKTGGMDSREYALTKSKDSSKYKTIFLDKKEYAVVMHALNTDLTEEDREHKIIHKAIGNYYYTVENNGYDNYRIIGRKKIPEAVTMIFERDL